MRNPTLLLILSIVSTIGGCKSIPNQWWRAGSTQQELHADRSYCVQKSNRWATAGAGSSSSGRALLGLVVSNNSFVDCMGELGWLPGAVPSTGTASQLEGGETDNEASANEFETFFRPSNLVESCSAEPLSYQLRACKGYLAALVDILYVMRLNSSDPEELGILSFLCGAPPTLTIDDLVGVIVLQGRRSPPSASGSGASWAIETLDSRFPCDSTGSSASFPFFLVELDQFKEQCISGQQGDASNSGTCHGYVAALHDFATGGAAQANTEDGGDLVIVCAPKTVTIQDMVNAVLLRLKMQGGTAGDEVAAGSVLSTLMEEFPCS